MMAADRAEQGAVTAHEPSTTLSCRQVRHEKLLFMCVSVRVVPPAVVFFLFLFRPRHVLICLF